MKWIDIHTYLERASCGVIFIISVGMVVILGIIDLATGYEISFSIFYLLPIVFSAWYSSRSFALTSCVLSAISWLYVDIYGGHIYSQSWIPFWNTGVRLGFFLAITVLSLKLKEHVHEEELISRTDNLTGVMNTRAFREILSLHIEFGNRIGRPLTLAYLDLDNFKYVNDNMGHSTGDRVLSSVASTLSSLIRVTDTVGRLGGDEFAILLPNTGLAGARAILEKVHACLLNEMKSNSWPVGFSVGVAVFNHMPASVDEAIQIADRLMYVVKRGSKNSIEYMVQPESVPNQAL